MNSKMTAIDYIAMFLLTIVFAGLVFWNLGSMNAPETYLHLKGEGRSNEIVLNFGEETEISNLHMFLGYESQKSFEVLYYSEAEEVWYINQEDCVVKSPFCWNTIELNRTCRYVKLISKDAQAYIHELIVEDADGSIILPANYEKYPDIFDEQEYYPENATYYYCTMFDEVYHGRTAYEFLHDLPIYETTHPPLGKALISLGIMIFGMTPFGWRFMSALCGTLMLPVLYLFVKRMSGKTKIAVFSTCLLFTEFMHFTLSRIATLDVIVALFVLMMFYFMFCFVQGCGAEEKESRQKRYLLMCGISTACAVATKWTGIYATAGICVLFFWKVISKGFQENWSEEVRRWICRLFPVCVVSFVVIPGIVYLLSYIQFAQVYPEKGLLLHAIENGKYMLTYHRNTFAEHPYSSVWYEWITMKQPVLDSYTFIGDGEASIVATLGNPLICWGGIAALIHNVYLWVRKKEKNAGYLCIIYAVMLFPWILIRRTVFVYQYFINLIILILMIGNSIAHVRKKQNQYIIGLLLISMALFVLFYPVLSGTPVEIEFVNQVLEWRTTWIFA